MIHEIIKKLENKKIAILGFGREGKSTYEFIRKYLPTIPLFVLNQDDTPFDDALLKKDHLVKIITGNKYLENLSEYDFLIKSPGISLKDINTENIRDKITSQMELLLEVASKQVIGITGTKGKSTTSSLIFEIIKRQNKNCILAGNIGIPVLSTLDDCDENTIFVMEMSSHQLEFLRVSPHIGIILNLFEDHLDHAGTLKHYHEIKMNMFKNQTEEDIMIYCSDNPTLKKRVEENKYNGKPYKVSLKEEGDIYKKENWLYFKDKKIYDTNSKRNLLGSHNLENIAVSLLVSELLNLDLETTKETIANFKPLDYRMESIGKIEEIEYVVDTLSTIPEATIASIEALKNVNTLIFGGMDRGISYDKLVEYLNKSTIEHFICMPTTAHHIAKFLPKEKVFLVNTLEEAVEIAKKVTKKNTICLLSPAASSYEQFKNYQEKGDKFKEFVYKK